MEQPPPGLNGRAFTQVIRGASFGSHPFRGYNMTVDRNRASGNAVRNAVSGERIGRIIVHGEFGPLLAAALPECEVACLSGETHVAMRVRDEAELYGVLARLRDLGASLVSVSVDP